MSNQLVAGQAKKPSFTATIASTSYQKVIHNAISDPKKAERFVTAITSAVVNNPALQECDYSTIITAALQGETLNLLPTLGQYYLVPFKQKEKRDSKGNIIQPEITKAQFVLGYKGLIQLAIRSGQYKKLNVIEVKEGELFSYDPLNEEVHIKLIEDEEERDNTPTIGYFAMFEYLNGFRKTVYWSKQKMLIHADRYSPAFSKVAMEKLEKGEIPNNELWKYSSFWYKNFDDMAKKTLLRHLISRWGVMSTELQEAFEKEQEIENQSIEVDFEEPISHQPIDEQEVVSLDDVQ